jgi:hypothetical protein
MKTLTILSIIAIILGAGFILRWVYSEMTRQRKAEEAEYESHYRRIQDFIRAASVTPENYEIITRMLCYLGKLPHKNKEKTSTLTICEFLVKFEMEVKRRREKEVLIPSN